MVVENSTQYQELSRNVKSRSKSPRRTDQKTADAKNSQSKMLDGKFCKTEDNPSKPNVTSFDTKINFHNLNYTRTSEISNYGTTNRSNVNIEVSFYL